jgi:hypothetical protein
LIDDAAVFVPSAGTTFATTGVLPETTFTVCRTDVPKSLVQETVMTLLPPVRVTGLVVGSVEALLVLVVVLATVQLVRAGIVVPPLTV